MSRLSKTDSFLAKGMPSSDGGEKERHLTIFSHALTMAFAFGTCIFGSRTNARPTRVGTSISIIWPRDQWMLFERLENIWSSDEQKSLHHQTLPCLP